MLQTPLQYGGQVLGAQFLGSIGTGMIVMASLTLLAGPVAAVIVREPSSTAMPKKHFTLEMFVQNFIFPIHHARDFYLAVMCHFFSAETEFSEKEKAALLPP